MMMGGTFDHDYNIVGVYRQFHVKFSTSPLMIMFHKVGPATEPWGQPFLTILELDAFPTVMWDVRFCRKLLVVRKMLEGHFWFHRRERMLGCQALSKAPAMSSVRRQHFCFRFLVFWTKSMTALIASVVDLPLVKPYCSFGKIVN